MALANDKGAARTAGAHDAELELAGKLARVTDELRERGPSDDPAALAETRYARSGDLSIAYQVNGQGPDVVLVPGSLSHVELGWETPPYAPIYRRLSRFARMITFDKRGMGLSDRSAELPTLEQRMDDVRAVMDAAGCERAARGRRIRGRPDGDAVRGHLSRAGERAGALGHLRSRRLGGRLSGGIRPCSRRVVLSIRSRRAGARPRHAADLDPRRAR